VGSVTSLTAQMHTTCRITVDLAYSDRGDPFRLPRPKWVTTTERWNTYCRRSSYKNRLDM